MPLPRNQNNIPRPSRTDSNRNRPRPVFLHHTISPRLPHACQSLFNNRHRLLTPRIVTRQHHQITPLTRRPPHARTLRPVPIPATSKQRNHFAAALLHQLPRQRNQIPQSIIRMRIIHDNRHAIRRRHHLKPSRHLCPRSCTGNNLIQRQSARQCCTGCRKQVVHIHSPSQR